MICESWFEAILHLLDVYHELWINWIEPCSAMVVFLETTGRTAVELQQYYGTIIQ
jgi:hypothetical protein